MSPRETIAKAISDAYETRHLKTDIWLEMADAVIDALAGMGISPEMGLAACKVSREYELGLEAGDALALWQAMVGAMRDE